MLLQECLLKEIDTTAVEVSVLYSKYVLSFTDQTSAPWNFGGNCPEAAHADYGKDIGNRPSHIQTGEFIAAGELPYYFFKSLY